jgi:putative transposase
MERKNRKTNRLKDYDYSQNGMYFVTVCTKDREELFGEIKDGEMILNRPGRIVSGCYLEIPKHFKNVFLDEYVVMPNHIHGIIEIINNVGADLVSARTRKGQTQGLSLQNKNNIGLLSKIIQSFKSRSSVEYIKLMKSDFGTCITKIWQRSFYDRIIRNETELNRIREYIYKNPQNWEQDRNNVENIWM